MNCDIALSQIQVGEAATNNNLEILPYSEGPQEILENVETIQKLIKSLNMLIYNYGKMNCPGDVSDLSRPRKDHELKACEKYFDRFPWYSSKKLSYCHQEGFSDLQEKFAQEGCETLLNRIKSGQVAMGGGVKWLADGGLNMGHETNVKTMRAALELLNAEFYHYSKMGCESNIEELASWGFDKLNQADKK